MPNLPGRAAWRLRIAWACVGLLGLTLVPLTTLAQIASAPTAGGTALITASGGQVVLLRADPGWDAAALASLGEGTPVDILAGPYTVADGSIWYNVAAAGQVGYVPAGSLAGAPAAPAAPVDTTGAAPDGGGGPTAPAGPAVTTSDVNLRAGPDAGSAVLRVLPPGSPVTVTGAPVNGYTPVASGATNGWVATEYLGTDTTPAQGETVPAQDEPPAPRDGPPSQPPALSPSTASTASTAIAWPFRGGTWHVIQGYNNGTHTNRSAFAQYQYAMDWARVDGETAGQPVYAPVSGTIQWADRGSGGLLIDAGNGYGVALFHVTLDGGLGRGQPVQQGQRLGTISGPGGDGYMSTAHVEIDAWQLNGDGGHTSVPFTGPNAIAGMEFPDTGGVNQYLGAEVTP